MDRVGPTDYRIRIGGVEKVYHINMLKRYFEASTERKDASQTARNSSEVAAPEAEEVIAASVVEEETDDVELDVPGTSTRKVETVSDVNVGDEFGSEQQRQLWELLHEFEDIFSSLLGDRTRMPGNCVGGQQTASLLVWQTVRFAD